MEKPDVDFIEGLSPAISIDQKSTSRNPRSTVGTITEIYDYLRVLYARVGHPHCYNCGRPIGRQTPDQIVDQIMRAPRGHEVPGARARRPGSQGGVRQAARGPRSPGVPAGADRRRGARALASRSGSRRPTSTRSRSSSTASSRSPDIRRRVADSIETALELAEGIASIAVHDARRARGAPDLLAAPGLHALRPLVRGARTAELLVQLAVRRVHDLRRARDAARGRPRARRPRRRPVRARRRPRPVGERHARVLEPRPRGGGRGRTDISTRRPRGRSSRSRPATCSCTAPTSRST